MSSSDSDDGLCGNITKKLHQLRNKYRLEQYTGAGYPQTSHNIIDETQDDIIVVGEKEKDYSYDPARDLTSVPRKTRKKTANRPTKRGRKTSKTNTSITNDDSIIEITDDNDKQISYNTRSKSAGKGRVKSRGRGARRGRGGSRNRGRGNQRAESPIEEPSCNIGSDEEYEDELESVQLFSSKPTRNDEVVSLNDSDIEDNEELPVKVNFKSIEIVKFNIRKFQKFTVIFEYFSKKENISINNLLFLYNDKIIKPDHTPDSINYNIAKFIEGGVVFNNVTKVKYDNKTASGIKIKFQIQKSKTRFEEYLGRDEKLSLAMIKVAEQLETPLNKLKFQFDGDYILGFETPKDLDMEGEECIDVKIIR